MNWLVTFHWDDRSESLTVEAPNGDAAMALALVGHEPFEGYLIEAVHYGPPEGDGK